MAPSQETWQFEISCLGICKTKPLPGWQIRWFSSANRSFCSGAENGNEAHQHEYCTSLHLRWGKKRGVHKTEISHLSWLFTLRAMRHLPFELKVTKLFAPNLIGRRAADTGHSKFRLVNFRWRPLGPCRRRTSSFYCLLMARPKVHFLAPGLILEDFAPRPSKQADSVVHIHIVPANVHVLFVPAAR